MKTSQTEKNRNSIEKTLEKEEIYSFIKSLKFSERQISFQTLIEHIFNINEKLDAFIEYLDDTKCLKSKNDKPSKKRKSNK